MKFFQGEGVAIAAGPTTTSTTTAAPTTTSQISIASVSTRGSSIDLADKQTAQTVRLTPTGPISPIRPDNDATISGICPVIKSFYVVQVVVHCIDVVYVGIQQIHSAQQNPF